MTLWACDRLRPALVASADGPLPATVQARLDRHVARCAACAADLAAVRALPATLAAVDQLPSGRWQRQRLAVRAAIDTQVQGRATIRHRVAMAGAAALAAAAVAVATLPLSPPPPTARVEELDGDALLALADMTRTVPTEAAVAADESPDSGAVVELPDDDLAHLSALLGEVAM